MKKLGMIFGIICFCLLLTGCSTTRKKDSDTLKIVTSFYPMYIATSNIVDGVEGVSLTNMTKPEVGCLHDYQLTTKDMNELERADVFVINGGGMEAFLGKAMSNYPDLKIINASEGILEETVEEEHHEGNHHEEEENAHVWVSVSLYIQEVENIARQLALLDPAHQTTYEKNAQKYIALLEQLKQEMHQKLDEVPHKEIVTFHEAFDYFAEEFGLQIVAVVEREPGTNPSAGELAKIIEIVKDTDASAIFVEPQYEASTATVIAKETGKPVYKLDPVVTGELTKDAYENAMRKNMQVLEEALR